MGGTPNSPKTVDLWWKIPSKNGNLQYLYIYVYVYIDKVIIVDNRLCLCHYAFCFLHMKCVCVCLRACLGGWACGCFYQVWLEEVYKKYKTKRCIKSSLDGRCNEVKLGWRGCRKVISSEPLAWSGLTNRTHQNDFIALGSFTHPHCSDKSPTPISLAFKVMVP